MRGVVASPHHLASEAGADVLRDGGTAADAAVAANAVLCVVYPHMTSIGGDLMAMVWPAGETEPVAITGAGRSGSAATIDAVRAQGHESMPERGGLTVTVPGTVQSWGRLVERFGRMGLGRLLAPAARLARDGFPVTAKLAAFLAESAGWRLREPEHARLLPAVQTGMTLRNPDLAGVLDDIGRGGWLGFHRGAIAEAIAAALARRGGLVTLDDLGGHRSDWVSPVKFRFRGVDVYQMPPPTQGLVAAGMLARLERDATDPGPSFARRLGEVRDITYGLRAALITDPDFAEVPAEPFLDPDAASPRLLAPAPPEGDTVYLCAADAEGNLVSLMQSVAFDFGSGVIAEGTGIELQNRGAYFSLDPAHVNRIEPSKRTMHTLIPAMAGRDGRPWAAFGSMGGDGQPQLQVQVLLNLLAGMEPAAAVAHPRVRYDVGGTPLLVEADYPGAAELQRTHGGVRLMPPLDSHFGHAHAIVLDGKTWRAGADPRSDGSAAEA